MSTSLHFIPGQSPGSTGPLARFLPPIPDGIASTWLCENLPAGSWVIDPFGSLPRLVAEAARAGYRLLVSANNPIERFLLEIITNPPSPEDFQSAIADLAVVQKTGDRIEQFVRSLYSTTCAQCGHEISADTYIWEKESNIPVLRIYTCPYCEDQGEHHISQADLDQASKFTKSGIHYARALERVASINDPDRVHAEEALETYSPRTVYALFTIINKMENMPTEKRKLLSALLLVAMDLTNSLWSYPLKRTRPKQLVLPTNFVEMNLWLALEQACEQLSIHYSYYGKDTIPLTIWPELPPETGGVCLYNGPLRDLIQHLPEASLKDLEIKAVLSALPRPNQAYWTLSAFWAGWIWGKDASAPLKGVLSRRRYDWHWHASALYKSFLQLNRIIVPGTPFLGLIGEVEPNFVASALIAAELTGFNLADLALRIESGQAQILWERSTFQPSPIPIEHLNFRYQDYAIAYLKNLGEPTSYIHLHAATLAKITQSHQMITMSANSPSEILSQTNDVFAETLSNREVFVRHGSSESSLDSRQWWLNYEYLDRDQRTDPTPSLADRVEFFILNQLQTRLEYTIDELDTMCCLEFPGLFTPELELVQACLESYSERDLPEGDRWRLRYEDFPRSRNNDISTICDMLVQIGKELDYTITTAGQNSTKNETYDTRNTIIWQSIEGKMEYLFHVIATAIIGSIVNSRRLPFIQKISPDQPSHNIIVIPGGRSSLINYKYQRNVWLQQEVEAGWRLVKFRHVRRLFESAKLSRENLDLQLEIDPLAYEDPQIPLL